MLKQKKNKSWILRLLGIFIYTYILSRIQWDKFLKCFNNKQLWLLTLVFGINMLLVLIKSFRWKLIINNFSSEIELGKLYRYYLIGIFLGSITPGKVGEIAKAYYLKSNHALSFTIGIYSILIDRIFDLYILSIASLILMYFFFIELQSITILILLAFFIIIPPLIIAFKRGQKLVVFIIKKFLNFILLSDKVKIKIYSMKEIIRDTINFKLLYIFLLSVLSFIILALQYYIIAIILNIKLNMFIIAGSMALANIVTILPISFSGLGTRDAALWFLWKPFNISLEVVTFYSLTVLITSYIFLSFLGMIMWWKHPIYLRRIFSQKINNGS